MINLILGENEYLQKKAKTQIVEEANKAKALLFHFTQENKNYPQVFEHFEENDLFSQTKYLIFSGLLSSPTPFNQELVQTLRKKDFLFETDSPRIYFIDFPPKNKKEKLYQLLAKRIKNPTLLDNPQLKTPEQILQQEAQDHQIKIDPREIKRICLLTNQQLWPAINELHKLNTLKRGGTITLTDVDSLIEPDIVNDIFKTIDAISQGNKTAAALLIHGHLKAGDDPLYLISMIVYQFRILLKVKDAQETGLDPSRIAAAIKVHPFVAQKSQQFCQKFSQEKLKKLYLKLVDIDQKIKNGSLDPVAALDLFIAFS